MHDVETPKNISVCITPHISLKSIWHIGKLKLSEYSITFDF